MQNIFVFSQHLKIQSLAMFSDFSTQYDENVFITTHFLFENERHLISRMFPNCTFSTFADYIEDSEMENCDNKAYSANIEYNLYLYRIKKEKNKIISNKVIKQYPKSKRYIFSNDLGICLAEWKKQGFKYLTGEYYYETDTKAQKRLDMRNCLSNVPFLMKVYYTLRKRTQVQEPLKNEEVLVAFDKGRKYIFIGKISRLNYRLSLDFQCSEEEAKKLNSGIYEKKNTCTYLTTWHEHAKCRIPDEDCYEVRWAQDGYLPPNYSHKDYYFKPSNVVYYCWDKLGTQLFINQNLPYELIPFRKKLYLPSPIFKDKLDTILIVASGSGDWTALKNRSDDDLLVDAFVRIAREFPQINFIYRCHPTWIHPQNVGVNAINRVKDYFDSLGLKNLKVSSNIPLANQDGKYQLTFSRSSLDEDLKKADFVFGEHSISMIDAAFQCIPFASVNVTNRRNFFCGITNLGFPHCTSFEQIKEIILSINDKDFRQRYLEAVKNYNIMTDED